MELTVFKEENLGQVRTVEKEGEVWFVAKDVCTILDVKNTSQALQGLDEDEKLIYTLHISGQNRETAMVNESGLYTLVIRSNKPEAKQFRKWITSEVLPSIRKHGMYATEDFVEMALSDPDHMIKVLQMFKAEREKRVEAEKTVNILTHVNKTYTATEVAKEIGFKSAISMNKWLYEQGVQYKQNGTWIMYSRYSALGYDSIKQEVLDNGKVIYHRRITQRGREFIINLYNKVTKKDRV